MKSIRPDEEVVEKLRLLIADHGAEWAENYDMFLLANRTVDPYWEDGVDAIRDNTVEMLIFGKECMLKTARAKEDDLFEGAGNSNDNHDHVHDVLNDLAMGMDQKVREMIKYRQ